MDKKNYNQNHPDNGIRNITFDVDNINYTPVIQSSLDVQWTATDFTE